jgi:hypothetical protein
VTKDNKVVQWPKGPSSRIIRRLPVSTDLQINALPVRSRRHRGGVRTTFSPEMAERLTRFVAAMSAFTKRDVIFSGIAELQEICERTPGQPAPELKLGAFRSRGQVSLGFRIPLDLDERLNKLLRGMPRISKRGVIVAALDLILTRCESINGGPFSWAEAQAVSREAGQ